MHFLSTLTACRCRLPFGLILSHQTPKRAVALGTFRPEQHGPVNWQTLLLTEHLAI